ncbi:penicillin-binding protein activator LpoB [Helicobacter sp. 13S00401-1]|uniref:penicillin-binding protein activator LpoB n=1 Tax=Helicobacter sp. 13S00401-1 TaxID=1905758 RepID=UPI000BA5759B|nr:penicillin-binding protein activator LpoB [Helicobacter sp. 13S00401-1]PAF51415.1 penicillin-binding protein activator LpoB [Helicobacter sp. 13S00401-1]
MKKLLYIALFALFIAGCSNQVTYLNNADSKELTSVGIDFHDIESTARKSVQNLLDSSYVQNLSGKPKILAISDVINDTMQRVNTQDLTLKIARAMRNTGKFQLTSAISGSGGMTDDMISRARKLRDDKEVNQKTTIEEGNLIAPDLSLSGKIVQKNTAVGRKQRIDYSFILVLTDLKTGLVVWDDDSHIIKVTGSKDVAW